MSRRQDQRFPMRLSAYLLPMRKIARNRKRPDLAWAAQLALAQGLDAPGDAAAHLVLDPDLGLELPAPMQPRMPRRRVFGPAGLLVDHRPAVTTVVFGGSDYARLRRIRSGLANNPTFLRLYAGAAVLDSVRLTRTFFGLGPFRGDGLLMAQGGDGLLVAQGGDGLLVGPDVEQDTVTLRETVSAGYYQPLEPADRDARGDYGLGDEGRFSAAMDFDRRARDEVSLDTTVQVTPGDGGVHLTLDLTGAVVDWALELAFRPGGTLTGARPLREHAWQLDTGTAEYRVGADAITVSVLETTDGAEMAMANAHSAPVYEPGEEYRFLGGTDAVAGELLYVSGRVPARVRMKISVAKA